MQQTSAFKFTSYFSVGVFKIKKQSAQWSENWLISCKQGSSFISSRLENSCHIWTIPLRFDFLPRTLLNIQCLVLLVPTENKIMLKFKKNLRSKPGLNLIWNAHPQNNKAILISNVHGISIWISSMQRDISWNVAALEEFILCDLFHILKYSHLLHCQNSFIYTLPNNCG